MCTLNKIYVVPVLGLQDVFGQLHKKGFEKKKKDIKGDVKLNQYLIEMLQESYCVTV